MIRFFHIVAVFIWLKVLAIAYLIGNVLYGLLKLIALFLFAFFASCLMILFVNFIPHLQTTLLVLILCSLAALVAFGIAYCIIGVIVSIFNWIQRSWITARVIVDRSERERKKIDS